jgi:ATP-binding cassette subfamily C protein
VGSFLAFTAAFGVFSAVVLQFVDNILKWQNLQPAIEKTRLLFEIAPEKQEDIQTVGKVQGKIEMSNVSFRYNEDENMVLTDISLIINKGEYIGIVGSSGSGKSTLFRLLMGFEKPINGKIYYDDKDMDLLDKRELRKSFGVVLQDGQLIAGSIYENIVLASNAVSKEERSAEMQKVWQIVKKVGLEKDIVQMPMGMETMVAEGSGTISGGQRQRILIARALFNNPSIIYFDEATSALDNRTQAIVSDSLKELNITRVVIAHRLSTVKDCDRIIVIDKGRLVESGTYDELMEKKGYYYRMALRQIA